MIKPSRTSYITRFSAPLSVRIKKISGDTIVDGAMRERQEEGYHTLRMKVLHDDVAAPAS
jgi:hypothetical protein